MGLTFSNSYEARTTSSAILLAVYGATFRVGPLVFFLMNIEQLVTDILHTD